MKLKLVLFGLFVYMVTLATASPLKRETGNELNPINEDNHLTEDDDDVNRNKRKVGIITLAASNGIINLIFGKLDALLDAKTNALIVLDESNKAKNLAFDIDPNKSALTGFLNHYISQKQKISGQAFTPILNSAATFFSTAKNGIANAVAAKVAPLSSLSSGLVGGLSSSSGSLSGGSSSGGGDLSGNSNGFGNILSSKIQAISSLSGPLSSKLSGGSGSSGSGGNGDNGATGGSFDDSFSDIDSTSGNGVTVGDFDNLSGNGGYGYQRQYRF